MSGPTTTTTTAADGGANTVTLQAQCLCRAHSFSTTIPRSSLPLKASSCHCTSCRHVTGALRSCDIPWPGPIAADIARSELRRYAHSPRVNVLFCGRCGTGMFFEEAEGEGEGSVGELPRRYGVFTGVLDFAVNGDEQGLPERLVTYEDHVYVGDTLDGGAAPWLRRMNGDAGEPVKLWLGGRNKSEEVPAGVQWPPVGELPAYEVDLKAAEGDKGNVPIRCHCRGVDLVLRAGQAQRDFAERQKKGEKLSWIVDPVTHKLIGGFDGCTSCRVWGGSEVFNWTFTMVQHLSFAGGESGGFPLDTVELQAAVEAKDGRQRDPRFGTLAIYASSPDVQRYFCSRCSASVFYAVNDRPGFLDVAVGVLDSPDGARAESVISWAFGGDMVWRVDMVGSWRENLMHAVESESEQWRVERGYPKNWHRVASEEAAKKSEEEAK
ncbi:hypothetical protein MFIFM68171_05005 [Madurella fahalii]|uniref:CENP-V/GFA domain-containing protein n=1 Tax=Madurella fahalii TaxID=1157608 RepID=A0ABQ0GAK2_9PEZI